MNRLTKIGTLLAVGFVAMSSPSAFGCAKSDAAPGRQADGAPAAVSSVAAPAIALQAASQSYDEAEFTLRLESLGAYSAQKPASAQVVLEAKSGFKCNDKYPYKFKFDANQALSFPAAVVGPEAMTQDKSRGVMKLDFVPQQSGQQRLSGTFSFSVCTEEKCLVERRQLALDITVGDS